MLDLLQNLRLYGQSGTAVQNGYGQRYHDMATRPYNAILCTLRGRRSHAMRRASQGALLKKSNPGREEAWVIMPIMSWALKTAISMCMVLLQTAKKLAALMSLLCSSWGRTWILEWLGGKRYGCEAAGSDCYEGRIVMRHFQDFPLHSSAFMPLRADNALRGDMGSALGITSCFGLVALTETRRINPSIRTGCEKDCNSSVLTIGRYQARRRSKETVQ